ncbi:hypothetical protein RHMOL_Rhmol07G0294600 [Rhododendron molle]|uniref:Uncharacterized protein n=1 Tax=Rhododendron molle TaxID=49168 RepID=A0ACC0N7K0_RHOML|nr:hypothetical protein RHMOL_Rhmol07G0294600 [Rhododendron molle]
MFTGRAGVPMEVMGLMLGEFVDEYTVRVVDVFAMPQSGTGVSVEAVDHVFQTNMLDMLKQTGRDSGGSPQDPFVRDAMTKTENMVPIAAYLIDVLHSEGLIGTVASFNGTMNLIQHLVLLHVIKDQRWWLDGTIRILDLAVGSLVWTSTLNSGIKAAEVVGHAFQVYRDRSLFCLALQPRLNLREMLMWHVKSASVIVSIKIADGQSFEALNQRAVAVVVDPIQSVKGKVVIDAFRLINPQTMMLGQEPRQTTSNLGHLNKPSIQALIHGLNRHYYSIAINYRKNELEEKMLLNLHKKRWTDGLTLQRFDAHSKTNEQTVQEMLNLAIKYNKAVQEEDELPPEKLAIANVGRQDAKKHLEEHVSNLMSSNIIQTLGTMLDTVVF